MNWCAYCNGSGWVRRPHRYHRTVTVPCPGCTPGRRVLQRLEKRRKQSERDKTAALEGSRNKGVSDA